MNAVAVEQGGALWHAGRAGKITASRMKDVMATSVAKGKEGVKLKDYYDYLTELVVERLTGIAIGVPSTPAMLWGKQCEEAARSAYEAREAIIVHVPGLIDHETLPFVGASPDGLIGYESIERAGGVSPFSAAGGLEIKCPFNMVNHLTTLRGGMPDEHRPQVQAQMWVAKLPWVDFVSFDPRFPPKYRLYVQRIPRDEEYISRLEAACVEMDLEVRRVLHQLENGM